MQYNSIEVWGDSILKGVSFDEERQRYAILRQNCVVMLSGSLSIPIVNHSRMGATAPEIEIMMRDANLASGGLALIEFGGNDCDMPWADIARFPDALHCPRTPLPLFSEALSRIVVRLRDANMYPMLVTPPPLDAERYFDWVTRDLDRETVLRFIGDVQHIYRWQERYAFAVAEVALQLACPMLALRDLFLDHMHYTSLLCIDGIHPNALGHETMLQGLKTIL